MVLHLLPDEGKKNEEQRGFAAADLRQIIDTVPSFLWSADPNGEPTYVNQRALDYSGMGFEEFKRGGWEAFIHPDDFPETIRAFSDAIQTGSSYETVHRLRRADGVFRWHHARGEPLRDREGRIIQWYGLAVDIDEVKKAEDHLRRSEANLAEAQRLSHTGSWALNPSAAKIFYWSEECYRIGGLTRRMVSRSAKLCGNGSIQTTKKGFLKRPNTHCARRETIRASSELSSPMAWSNISKQ